MENLEVKSELPPNYEQLKTSANRASNWRERLAAVEELGQWKNKQSIDILTHRMNNDVVYTIQEAAYRTLKAWGEEVPAPPKEDNDFLIKGVTKILIRIKKSLPKDHTYEAFKEKLKKMRLDVYDAYEGAKGADFDQWLESKWASLSIK
ncbi:HEAT repeat domain-containing protein [Paenibacillus sp. MBLB4367]|uniref:HEAT repeat domain-containing protein n=1 Tax=Paenibacillus sp. MBLB4367 TaxID=3384767 RepID=UPI0039080304